MKTIGILGGMGPGATNLFYQKIIHIFQSKHQAFQDTDFPKMIIYSLPLEGFDETGIVDKTLVLKQLFEGVKLLNNASCDFIVIPCNTVHYFINELQNKSKVPIISIVKESCKKLVGDNISNIALFGSDSTVKLSFYQELLNNYNINFVIPSDEGQKATTNLIAEVMGGKINSLEKIQVLNLIEEIKEIQAVLLACTELPLAIQQSDLSKNNIKIYDTLQILAEATVEYCIGKT
ncbi:MAG: amino acid racemase [Candidatus Woesearchaeota archaeon]